MGRDWVLRGPEEAWNSAGGGWGRVPGWFPGYHLGHVLKDGWGLPVGKGVGEVGRREQQVMTVGTKGWCSETSG